SMRLALAWLVLLGCGDRNTRPPARDEQPAPRPTRAVGATGQNIVLDDVPAAPRAIDPKEAREAANFVVRTVKCEQGEVSHCNELAIDYELARGVRKNMAKALELYRKGCAGDVPAACYNTGLVYQDGKGVPKDAVEAVGWFKKSCGLEDQLACVSLGE